jgi:tRNA 5-methylaminomethyl-2-thiouridine biosynthesis bifunctional protein
LGPQAVIAAEVEQLARVERDGPRFDAVIASGLFADGALRRTADGLLIVEGLTVRPARVREAWLDGCPRLQARCGGLERRDGRWIIRDEAGAVLAEADVVCLAAGAGGGTLAGLPFTPVRGQASWVEGLAIERARAWGGYAAPMDGGVLFGATHDRGRSDGAVLAEDHARNLHTLAEALPALAEAAAQRPMRGRAGVRAATFDRMPVADALEEGLYVLGGLGSRGFCTAPLLAEHVAALALGAPSPLPRSLQPLVGAQRLEKRRPDPTAC